MRLIHDGQLRLDKIEDHSEDELRTMLDRCGASISPGSTKVCERHRERHCVTLARSCCRMLISGTKHVDRKILA